MNVIEFTTLLGDPARFFERRGEEPSLFGPLLVVAVVALCAAVGSVVTTLQLGQAIQGDLQMLFLFTAVVQGSFALVVPFVSWVLYVLGFTAVAALLGGDSDLRELFALTGWGFFPQGFGTVVTTLVVVATLHGVELSPVVMQPAWAEYPLRRNVFFVVSYGMPVLATLWSAYIWLPAVRRVTGLGRRRAVVTVAIPVSIGIAITVFASFVLAWL
ncbi:YIP1 family protein [Halomicrobium katesii]|uniref:YIP1 family protein n=1 Tax=Halomicrobium katesii TaxID=437163 RepID=UPI00036A3B49|nr:YIP1 family protein [Halomicrobium katesii]